MPESEEKSESVGKWDQSFLQSALRKEVSSAEESQRSRFGESDQNHAEAGKTTAQNSILQMVQTYFLLLLSEKKTISGLNAI
jgi:hypothetical protein